MRAANIRLARAIEAEHGYGPRVTEAIDETHEVMGELQKETLRHLFAMRSVLDARQAAMFDRSEEHKSELQSLMRISYAVFCLKKKTSRSLETTNYVPYVNGPALNREI